MRSPSILGKPCRFGYNYVAQTYCQWIVQARASLLLLLDNCMQLQPLLAIDELGYIRKIGQLV